MVMFKVKVILIAVKFSRLTWVATRDGRTVTSRRTAQEAEDVETCLCLRWTAQWFA